MSTPNRLRSTEPLLIRFAALLLCAVFLCGCIHIYPISKDGDRVEAMALARVLLQQVPEAKDLLHEEQLTANDLKVMLDQSAKEDFSNYRQEFDKQIQRFVAIRARREQIQNKVSQHVWRGTLDLLIQRNAIDGIQENLDRTLNWIQLAHNLTLRASFCKDKLNAGPCIGTAFPELGLLSLSLDSFLSEAQDEPMAYEISALAAEYKFKQSDL